MDNKIIFTIAIFIFLVFGCIGENPIDEQKNNQTNLSNSSEETQEIVLYLFNNREDNISYSIQHPIKWQVNESENRSVLFTDNNESYMEIKITVQKSSNVAPETLLFMYNQVFEEDLNKSKDLVGDVTKSEVYTNPDGLRFSLIVADVKYLLEDKDTGVPIGIDLTMSVAAYSSDKATYTFSLISEKEKFEITEKEFMGLINTFKEY